MTATNRLIIWIWDEMKWYERKMRLEHEHHQLLCDATHQKWAEHIERDEIWICDDRAAKCTLISRFGLGIGLKIAEHGIARCTVEHDFLPCFARCRAKQHQDSLWKVLEVVVTIDIAVLIVESNFTEDLDVGESIRDGRNEINFIWISSSVASIHFFYKSEIFENEKTMKKAHSRKTSQIFQDSRVSLI